MDFDDVGDDVIQLSTSLFANFAAVQAAMNPLGGDVAIVFDAANAIVLRNTTLASMGVDDFLFV
jgi:hypothetical protein